MANLDDFDFDLDELFSDEPKKSAGDPVDAKTSKDIDDILSIVPEEEKQEEPVKEDTKEDASEALQKTGEELAQSMLAATAVKPDDAVVAPEPEKAETKAEDVKEKPAPQEEPKPEPEVETKTEEKTEVKIESKTEEEPHDTAENKEVKDVPVASEAKNEDKEDTKTEETEEDIEVETSAPKKTKKRARRRTTKKEKAAPALDVSDIDKPGNIDEGDVLSLLVSPGENYNEQKKRIEEMENSIVLVKGMSNANIAEMNAKNIELRHYADTLADLYISAYQNLTDKETGLIARVRAKAEYETDGTQSDKHNAGTIAATNYVNAKGKKIDLLSLANALRSAKNFVEGAQEYSKQVGIALGLALKTSI